MYVIESVFDYYDEQNVARFDPTRVITQLRQYFPEVEVEERDYGDKDVELFEQALEQASAEEKESLTKCLRIAKNDRRRRGPIWVFHIPLPDGSKITGHTSRYDVRIHSDEPIPEPLKTQFTQFLEGLCVSAPRVKSYKLTGNDEEEIER